MSVENKCANEPNDCPHCKRLFEITAVKSSRLGRKVALFVCPGCGLARIEPHDARQKLRSRISALDGMLRELKGS